MLAERNELITRVGPGTKLGDLMRRYWQPIALVDELQGGRPVKKARLLGEDLVVFRDENGRYGVLDQHCAHRGADLCFGRLENGGLRCPFHGWLFDADGNCLETPAEPEGSTMHTRIKQPSYRTTVRSGIVFVYMGQGEPPAFPEFDCFTAPDAYTFAFKGMVDCNWLQAYEVSADPAHTSFLHRFFDDGDTAEGYGKPFRGETMGADMPITQIMREYPRPKIEVSPTDYGVRISTLRQIDGQNMHIRITNLVFPNYFIIPLSQDMTITQWQVPVDDTHNYWYAIFTSFGAPVDKDAMRNQRLEWYDLPEYMPKVNRSNNWGFDEDEQKNKTYLGMGEDVNVHDQWALESMGPIQDRTKEHLGQSDKAISAYRRILFTALEAMESGAPLMSTLSPDDAAKLTGPAAIDAIGPVDGWERFWQDKDQQRRAAAPWQKEAKAA